jgi:putative N6-adenine-specific DNA methylase
LWKRLRAEAQGAIRPCAAEIGGSDHDADLIAAARRNAQAAGVAEAVRFEVADFRKTGLELPPAEPAPAGGAPAQAAPPVRPGLLLVNPPYGERLSDGPSLARLYKDLGDTLKRRYKGWEAYVFAEHGELIKAIGLRASRRTILFNGALECRLLQYKLY